MGKIIQSSASKVTRRNPIKVKYISSPIKVKAGNPSEFRAIVQELTGKNSECVFNDDDASYDDHDHQFRDVHHGYPAALMGTQEEVNDHHDRHHQVREILDHLMADDDHGHHDYHHHHHHHHHQQLMMTMKNESDYGRTAPGYFDGYGGFINPTSWNNYISTSLDRHDHQFDKSCFFWRDVTTSPVDSTFRF